MAHPSPTPPPLLLTKRITSFLSHALSSHIHTALLCSPAGKLLAHVSAPVRPVADLRMQATVAASLITLYAAASTHVAPALSPSDDPAPSSAASASAYAHPHSSSPDHSASWPPEEYAHEYAAADSGMAAARAAGPPPARPHTITVQLTTGAVVVRELACGLLFVCVGSSPSASAADESASTTPRAAPPVMSAGAMTTASVASTASAGAAAAVGLKKAAEEFARRLDGRLAALCVPEEGAFE
ncbi:hypothetical protein TD95_000018 [Thielaviopsis punctulata]|uniref:Uncharacterized protein n=1 Tax=Thielaviopsis punctulata TaxID=72032 RepID=A0A0F4Z6P9_9PEZI|nr:hypothetical protein TD95_000018 [Thielaviopsis punctulata]